MTYRIKHKSLLYESVDLLIKNEADLECLFDRTSSDTTIRLDGDYNTVVGTTDEDKQTTITHA